MDFTLLKPLCFVHYVSNQVSLRVLKLLAPLDDNWYTLVHKCFNLLALISIHYAFTAFSGSNFCKLVLILAITKHLLRARSVGKTRVTHKTKEVLDSPVNIGAEDVESFFTQNHRSSLTWLNKIISTLWLNYRAYTTHWFLNVMWPQVQEQLKDTHLKGLSIHKFSIGDRPFRIDKIDSVAHGSRELIVDVRAAYDGNASISITLSQEQLNISIPVTLENFSVSNVKLRIVLKHLIDQFPLVSGCQVFFLELPKFNWKTADAAKVADLPGLENLIKSAIESQIIRRFVLPNRLAFPVKLPQEVKTKLQNLGLKVADVEDFSVAMPVPVGVVKVTVVEGQELKPTDLSFKHYKDSKNLNILSPKTFAASELLPKRSTSNPYVVVSIGSKSHESLVVENSLDPFWNFECCFPIEYYQGQKVTVDVYDDGQIEHTFLGKATEKLDTVFDRLGLKGWYNLQVCQGRILVTFELIPLTVKKPLSETGGVMSLLLGKLTSQYEVRPSCQLILYQGDNKTEELASLEALSTGKQWTFNEGKLFRIENVLNPKAKLTIKIWDDKSSKWIGQKSFRLDRQFENESPGKGEILFPNPFNTKPPVHMSVYIAMYSDIQ